nr:MAG: Nif3-like dinuclear metal center hexameric protein [Pseudomonadota bacterium]
MCFFAGDLLRALEAIAPLELAEDWDNTGLLLDPRAPGQEMPVERVLLAIDATEDVIREAVTFGAQCLVAYHPPLFAPKKRFARRTDPVVFTAVAHGIAVYSPHTALDAAPSGLNDWLSRGLGAGTVEPLFPAAPAEPNDLKLVVFVPEEHADALRDALAEAGAGVIGAYSRCSFTLRGEGTFFGHEGTNPAVGAAGQLERVPEIRLEMVCPRRALPAVTNAMARVHPYEEPAWDVYPLAPRPRRGAGPGRRLVLDEPAPLSEIAERLKRHLGLSHVGLAASARHRSGDLVRTIALAAGAGGSLFERGAGIDLYVTGEMRHHDVLAKLASGASVLLAGHSNTERGYLPTLRDRLSHALDGRVEIKVSTFDREPIAIV